MSEDSFVPSIDESELKDGAMRLVNVAGQSVLLTRVGDQIFGVSNLCPCKGCSLSKGKLEEYILICPCHGWKFDVRNGQYLKTKEKKLTTHRCKIKDGKVYVEILDF